MKQLLTYILCIILLNLSFGQKGVKDPFKKWKEYKDKVDRNVSTQKYVLRKNIKMMCTSAHGIHVYTKNDTIVLIEGVDGHMCGHVQINFYYKNQKLMIVSVIEKITAKDTNCKDFTSGSKDYYIEGAKILNHKKFSEEAGDIETFYAFIKEKESMILEEIKEKDGCLD